MEYEGPHHSRLTKRLRKIAKEFGLKLWFTKQFSISGEYHTGDDRAVVNLDNAFDHVASTFFHELGHHLDYHKGLYPSFYGSTPLYKQRRIALKAERHADKIGKKLCKKYFPKVKYHDSYKSDEDLDYLKNMYGDGRRKKKKS